MGNCHVVELTYICKYSANLFVINEKGVYKHAYGSFFEQIKTA